MLYSTSLILSNKKRFLTIHLLLESMQWQKITIERIKQTADQARKEINQLINSKQNQTLLDFTSFSEQLALLRETENFVETDLATLKQRVDKFELELKELNQSTTFVLKTENSDRIDWTRLTLRRDEIECQLALSRQELQCR